MPKLILKEYRNLKKLRIFEEISENRPGLNESIDQSTPFCLQNHSQHQVFNNQYTGHSSTQDQVETTIDILQI
jgi:hypothetical protein